LASTLIFESLTYHQHSLAQEYLQLKFQHVTFENLIISLALRKPVCTELNKTSDRCTNERGKTMSKLEAWGQSLAKDFTANPKQGNPYNLLTNKYISTQGARVTLPLNEAY